MRQNQEDIIWEGDLCNVHLSHLQYFAQYCLVSCLTNQTELMFQNMDTWP